MDRPIALNPQAARRPARRHVVAGLAAVVAVMLAACGGGGGPEAAASEDTSGATAARVQVQGVAALAAGVGVQLSAPSLLVLQGSSATLRVTVTRPAGVVGEVVVSLADLPAGFNAPAVTVPADRNSATLRLAAFPKARHTLPTPVRVVATLGDAVGEAPLTVTLGGAPGMVDGSWSKTALGIPMGVTDAYVHGMAVQADGKVLLVGDAVTVGRGQDIALVRRLKDGRPDLGFGVDGKVITPVAAGAGSDSGLAVAVQPDGKIVVAGSTDRGAGQGGIEFVVLRYLRNGAPDTAFGEGGRVTIPFGPEADRARAVAIQPDGRIVVAGDSYQGLTGVDFALARLLPDGRLDPAFGQAGRVTTSVRASGTRDSAYALALQPVGPELRIVLAGGEGDFVVARYTSAGVLDPEFGRHGAVQGLFSSTIGAVRSIALQPDGKLVLAGGIENDVALARLDQQGRPDPTFGRNGRTRIALSTTNWDDATAVVCQADGKLVVGGWMYAGNSSSADMALLRLDPQGLLDGSFGTGGITITPLAAQGRNDAGRALLLQADPRIPAVRALQAGEVQVNGTHDFAVLRYWL